MFLQNIVKTDNIIKVLPQDSLRFALAKLSTSHDAAFVFSDDQKFLGVINPYYCLIKTSYPPNTKVEHCLFHPPKIKLNTPVHKVAEFFIQSKIHYLPVFDELDRFKGIVSARTVLSSFLSISMFRRSIIELLKTKKFPLTTIDENDSVSSAVHLFKSTKLSKLIVTDKALKLKGVLSYYDLTSFLISPKNSQSKGQREGSKSQVTNQKVKNFAKSFVLTLSPKNTIEEAIRLIITKSIGSVVIVDNEKHPTGIITTKDILHYFIYGQHEKKIEIVNQNLSGKSKHIFGIFFRPFSHLIRKIPDLNRVKLMIKEEKNGGLFKVILSLFPKKGNAKIIKREGKNLSHILPSVKDVARGFDMKKSRNKFGEKT